MDIISLIAFYLVATALLLAGTMNIRHDLRYQKRHVENTLVRGRRRGTINGALFFVLVGAGTLIGSSRVSFAIFWLLVGALAVLLGLVGLTLALSGRADKAPSNFTTNADFLVSRQRRSRALGVSTLAIGALWLVAGLTAAP